jgi:hypothetical protein
MPRRRVAACHPPARSQPRMEEKPAPARAFQPSLSDEEVTTFMPSPAKKPRVSPLDETGETKTSAKKHIRPPAPSIVDEDEEDGRTQIRPMPKGGKLSLPTSSVSIAKAKDPELGSARKDVRVPEISLPKSSAVVMDMPDDSGADAPDFTVQLGAGPSPAAAPAAPPSSPPPPMQMSTQAFAPLPGAPARPAPAPLASTAMMGGQGMGAPMPQGPGMMSGQPAMMPGPQPMMSGQVPAMMSGQVPAMMSGQVPAMMSGQVPAVSMSHAHMASMSGGFPQQMAPANMSGGYAVAGAFPGAPPSTMDPPGTAVSLSRTSPKPMGKWVVAFVAVSAAAAIAAFGLNRSAPSTQSATAAFVDPSKVGEPPAPAAAPQAPEGQPPVVTPAQPVAQTPPAQPTVTPADLIAAPVVAQPPVAQPGAVVAAAPVAAPVAPTEASKPAVVAAAPKAEAPKAEPKPVVAPAPAPVKVAVAQPAPEPKEAAPKPAPKGKGGATAAGPTKGPEEGPKKAPSAADKEMKEAADALAKAQLEQSL